MRFDTTYSPLALYHLDGDGTDYSGNGYDLTVTASPVYRHVLPGIVGLASGYLKRPSSDAALRLTGDFTILILCIMRAVPAAGVLVAFQEAGETEANNAQYLLRFDNQSTAHFIHERGAGVNDEFLSTGSGITLPSLNEPFLFAESRENGVVTFWLNGVQYGTSSSTFAAPTGGTGSVLQIGSATAGQPDKFGVKLVGRALTSTEHRDEYDRTLGSFYGPLVSKVESLWTGASTSDGITVVARMSADSDNLRLAAEGPSGFVYSSTIASTNRTAKFVLTGLDVDTEYTYTVEDNLVTASGHTGKFKTLPASGPASFMVAFTGDAANGTNPVACDAIITKNPLMFFHLGDLHYQNIATNNPSLFHAAYDTVQKASKYGKLLREVSSLYMYDDHDSGPNDGDSTAASRPASGTVYRARVPHYPLVDTAPDGGIYHTFDIGRVRFIVTDQRYYASPKGNTDNSSKSILGTTQKAWFKDQLDNASGKVIVWLCSRVWGGVPTAGADHWGGFTTERVELCDYIHSACPGRLVVISADMHSLAIDDGSHHNFATGGVEPIKTFQASPLDYSPGSTHGGATYSEGQFLNNGQFGTMEVTDTGGSSIDISWKGFNSVGTQLISYNFTVSV